MKKIYNACAFILLPAVVLVALGMYAVKYLRAKKFGAFFLNSVHQMKASLSGNKGGRIAVSKRFMSPVLACAVMMSSVTAVDALALSEAEEYNAADAYVDDVVPDEPEYAAPDAYVNDIVPDKPEYVAPDAYVNDIVLAEPEIIRLPDDFEYSPGENVYHVSPYQLVSPISLYSNGGARHFYDQLTSGEKNAYDMMKIALENDPAVASVEMTGITDFETVERAYAALVADHPEFFWLYGFSLRYTDDENGNITNIYVQFGYCAGQSASSVKSNYTALMNKVNSIVGNAGQYTSDYDKIKYFATYISDNMSYNDNAASRGGSDNSTYANCWNAYGALVRGSGVCEAYAEAFKLLCDTAGIQCISVYSSDHEWNAVCLDGSWYYVDVTWIDTGNKATYRYDEWLAVGTSSAARNDNAARSHTPIGNIILSGFNTNFSYPSISAADYEPPSDTDTGSGDDSGTGSGDSTTKPLTVDTKNKDINTAGSTSYNFTAIMAVPALNVSVPSNISVVINPYGVAVSNGKEDYGADGVTSPLYTIRNKTKTSAVSVDAELYLTVPKDKNGDPTIIVCKTPDEVKIKSEKALSAYMLASVSGSGVADQALENDNLIEANKVRFTAGKTLVFPDATLYKDTSEKGTLMVIPKAEYEDNALKSYYYGHFQVSGAVTDMSKTKWDSSDKVNFVVIFNVVPCKDPK
ncbi:MAG: hypothetical protein J1E40_06380 [Oscillospiraceae bacterium]|nr:hypothetical protein [Oscillospiraceae bacterium]